MKAEQYHKIIWKMITAAASVVVILLLSINAFATGDITESEQATDDVISLTMPAVSESDDSVFDFILDPQELVYCTDAARYGGGTVEEGATLLFCNGEGEYDFSRYSDRLTVTNQSTVAVQVTVTARITGLEGVKIVEDADFSEDTDPGIYFAIVDDRGNVQPLSTEGQASIRIEMDKDYSAYSFGLTGACNSNAEWQDVSIHPVIEVVWKIEPVTVEQEGISPEEDVFAGGETSAEEDIINEEDITEDGGESVGDEITGDDLQGSDVSDGNSDLNNDAGNATGEEQDDPVAVVPKEENTIVSDDISNPDNTQNADNE